MQKLRPLDSHEMKVVWQDFSGYSHVLFTSKIAVRFFYAAMEHFFPNQDALAGKIIFCIGKATATAVRERGGLVQKIALQETQEGLMELLRMIDTERAYVFYPRSSLARLRLESFLIQMQIRYQVCSLYDTITNVQKPLPDLEEFEEIVFTSPSTIKAFLEIYPKIPSNKKITCLGPVTCEALARLERK
jgi:uroporphyrinogen-III synthase